MKKNALLFWIVWMSLASLSLPSVAQKASDSKPYGGLLWKAEREHWTLYLYGVAHSADTALEINGTVRQLIESADIYVSELPLGKSVAHPAELNSIRREFIDKPFDLNHAAETALRKLYQEGMIGAYRYWTLRHSSQISATRSLYPEILYKKYADRQIDVADFPKPRTGPDRIALNVANSKRKNTIQIEPELTADRYWLKNCDNERDNSAYLLSAIDVATTRDSNVHRLHQQLAESDFEGFQKSLDEEMELDFFRLDYQCHVIDRNKFWAQSLNRLTSVRETSLRPEKSVMFFTFGATHAVTPQKFAGTSLIDYLRLQGWQVQSAEIQH